MNRSEHDHVDASSVGDLEQLIPSFELSLRASNKSPKTLKTYAEASRQLVAYLKAAGMPTEATSIRREHVESFIEHLLETRKPATANNRYRALAQLFKYLAEEGEIPDSPMAKMKTPRVPEELVPVLSEDDLRALLKACDGKALDDLRLDGIDVRDGVAIVMGKGRRPRACPFGAKTAQALDRYIRVRCSVQQSLNAWCPAPNSCWV